MISVASSVLSVQMLVVYLPSYSARYSRIFLIFNDENVAISQIQIPLDSGVILTDPFVFRLS